MVKIEVEVDTLAQLEEALPRLKGTIADGPLMVDSFLEDALEVDVDGIVDWALTSGPDGIVNLNKKLMDKYGEDLDSFLINAATTAGQEDDDDEAAGSESQGHRQRRRRRSQLPRRYLSSMYSAQMTNSCSVRMENP